MVNRKFFAGMLVMALLFGMTVLSCDDGSGSTDPALNGTTWTSSNMILRFDDGKFEISRGGSPLAKGTYTTKNGSNITMTVTDVHGGSFAGFLESRYYSKAELKPLLPEADFNKYFSTQKGTYSDTTLAIKFLDDTFTFTR